MSRLYLSNLAVRPNLLPPGFTTHDVLRCSVFELRDIKGRTDSIVPDRLPNEKQQEWRDSLFWGDSPPPPVTPGWAEHLASGLPEAVRNLEERPTLEAALECLILARQLYHKRPDGPARTAAAEWDRRICVVLARDEFRHTPDMIDQRLESILGRRLTGPPRPDASPVEPPVRSAAAAVSLRQPVLFPVAADAKTDAPHEPPSADDRDTLPQSVAVDARTESAPEPPAVLSSPVIGEVPPLAGPTPLAAGSPPPLPRAGVEPPKATPAAVTPGKPVDARPTPGGPPRPTTTLMVRDPDLKRLVQRWATLPDHVKKCVMMLLDAAEATQNATSE